MRQFLVFALVCVLSACTTIGRPITQAQLDQVIKGVTTREDVLRSFGPPFFSVEDSSGNETVTWTYGRSGFAGIGFKVQSLTVQFDATGKVEEVVMTEKSKPTQPR